MSDMPRTGIRALLITDLVGSTKLTESLGDARWAEVSARFDEMARSIFTQHNGIEIDKTDGFLVLFDRPIDGVRCALAFHRMASTLGGELSLPLDSRAGIHLGEVILRENAPQAVLKGAKLLEVEGLSKPMAARIMALARGRQTLLTTAAFEMARRASIGDAALKTSIAWRAHGPYSLMGVEDPVDVFEVGEEGFAPLIPPSDSEKAKSLAALDQGMVMGWRPSPGADIPSAPGWICIDRVGAGGFGEVWKVMKRASNEPTATKDGILAAQSPGSTLAFKFCFDLAHARALRREATLFKLIQQKFGHHHGIVRLIDFQLEVAPLYLAMEYVAGKNLAEWIESEGREQSLLSRLMPLSSVAATVAEIHGAGIILADIKPSNILIRYGDGFRRDFVIADLGIGRLREKELAKNAAVTKTTGFTKTHLGIELPLVGSSSEGAAGGSLLYLAPEIMEGTTPNAATDAYAFGVTLLQVAAVNPRIAVSDKWRRHVGNRAARKLISRLLEGDPARRHANFKEIAHDLARLHRRTIRWRMIQANILLLLIACLAFNAYWFGIRQPRALEERQSIYVKLEEAGWPTTERSYNKKYPTTRRGAIAVLQACQIARLLDVPISLSEAVRYYEPPPNLPGGSALGTAAARTLPIVTTPVEFFRFQLSLSHRAVNQRLDFIKFAPVLEANRSNLDAMRSLFTDAPPVSELQWTYDSRIDTPLPMKVRNLKGEEEPSHLGMASALLAAEVERLVTLGDYPAAYNMINAYRYWNFAISGQDSSLKEYELGFYGEWPGARLNGATLSILEALWNLMPPNEAEARSLVSTLQPLERVREARRQMDLMWLDQFILCGFLAGDRNQPSFRMRGLWGRELLIENYLPKWGVGRFGLKYWYVHELAAPIARPLTRPYIRSYAVEAASAIGREVLRTEDGMIRRGMSHADRKALMDTEEEVFGGNPVTAMVTPHHFLFWMEYRFSNAMWEHRLQLRAQLRLLELACAGDATKMPSRLDEILSAGNLPTPVDYLAGREGASFEYIPYPGLGVFKLSDSMSEFWGIWGERSTTARIIAVEADLKDPSRIRPEDRKYWMSNRHAVLLVQLLSGSEVRLLVPRPLADALGIPDKFSPGTKVTIFKRPVSLDGKPAFEILTREDLVIGGESGGSDKAD